MIKKNIFLFFALFSISVFSQLSDFNQFNFKKSDSIAKAYKGRDLRNLPILAYDLTSGLTSDLEKFRVIYKWVCSNIENSFFDSKENIYKRKKYRNDKVKLANWEQKIFKRVVKRLLNEQKTVCTGYAYLIKQLCVLSDIECVVVDGYSRSVNLNITHPATPNHSWNSVKLNNKWYLCDATWSSGFSYSNTGEFIFDYSDEYFLPKPEIFIKNHYPINLKWALLKKFPTLEEYIKAPLIYKRAYTYELIPYLPKEMFLEIKKGKEIYFEFKKLKIFKNKDLSVNIIRGLSIKKIKLNKDMSFSYLFKKKGNYDVHLKIGDKAAFTYVVKVIK